MAEKKKTEKKKEVRLVIVGKPDLELCGEALRDVWDWAVENGLIKPEGAITPTPEDTTTGGE